jgi:cystathionine beta-lyase/cystathionine gamma-synthase
LAAPALQQWLNILKKQVKQEAHFVVDNTCLALGMPVLMGNRKVKVIVWESLNKYYQFGLDRTTGGYIYASGMETLKLFYARMHAGTNMPDTCCSLLPKPQKHILMSRMKRMGRNAAWLANELSTLVSKPGAMIGAVVYPGLPTHPTNSVIKRYPFAGSSLVLTVKDGAASVRYLKSLAGKLIAEAKRTKVSLVAGSSFGLNVTRVYLVAMKNEYSAPFLRVSVGTETMMEMEQLLKVFKKVLS